ncbi:MAG: transglutaminase-like domain-containing protein [Nanoarchaeota archaeon]
MEWTSTGGICLIMTLLLITPALASPGDQSELTLEQEIASGFDIIRETSTSSMQEITAVIRAIPMTSYRQEVVTGSASEPGEITEHDTTFTWSYPKHDSIEFSSEHIVKTSARPKKIEQKTAFPLEDIPLEVTDYLEFTEHIDTSELITSKASDLAQGEDDLYKVEAKLAQWVHDSIQYNLTTLTEEVDQPASWVMEERYGVCDEITNLFIAMNRALGIPARFVSGIAYSEALEGRSEWGNHGWAEVYFPGTGWVPYDVTYNQMGFVDATHIALQKGMDGTSATVEYSYRGKEISIEQHPISFDTSIVKTSKKEKERTGLELEISPGQAGFGSYAVMTAHVTNPHEHYITEQLTLHPTERIELITPQNTQIVALSPQEKRDIQWMIRVDETLDEKYTYTFPLVVSRTFQKQQNISLQAGSKMRMYSKDHASSLMTTNVKTEEDEQSDITCKLDTTTLLKGTEHTITCTKGNLTENDLPIRVCHNSTCKEMTERKRTITLPLKAENKTQVTTAIIEAEDKKGNRITRYIPYTITDKPELEVKNVSIRRKTGFDDIATLSFLLDTISKAPAQNVTIVVEHKTFSKEWTMETLETREIMTLDIPGSRLATGNNTIHITVGYEGKFIPRKTIEKRTWTMLETTTLKQKMIAMLNSIDGETTQGIAGTDNGSEKDAWPGKIISIIAPILILFIIVKAIGAVRRMKRR